MGAHYRYTCPRCRYEEDLSGGADVGMISRTRTALCAACRRLVDVVVHLSAGHLRAYPEDAARLGRCPHCEGTEVTLLDEEPPAIPCPRCGSGMNRGELVTLWD